MKAPKRQTETIPKAKRKKKRFSCPKGWVPAGVTVPVRLTKRQEAYCERAIGIARFCYNLSVATLNFCQTNRLRRPSWMAIYKEFNRVKREDYSFVTEVSSKVAEGAFMDFDKAVDNWRNRELRSRAPKFKKKKATGIGSFRAASGVDHISYNGKRRIQLLGLGSVKLVCTIPKGIPHEARIERENGRWVLSMQYWKEPEPRPRPDHRSSRRRHQSPRDRLGRRGIPQPESLLLLRAETPQVAESPDTEKERVKGMVGGPEENRQVPQADKGATEERYSPDDQRPHPEVQETGHRGPERVRNDSGTGGKGPGRLGPGRDPKADRVQMPVEICDPHKGPPVLPQQQNLPRVPSPQRETQA